jgi:hypothetical protein
MKAEALLIHALSVRFDEDPSICRIRATIRAGSPSDGDVVYFEGLDRLRRELVIRRVRQSPHLYTIWLQGVEHDVKALLPGTYLHGM